MGSVRQHARLLASLAAPPRTNQASDADELAPLPLVRQNGRFVRLDSLGLVVRVTRPADESASF